MGNPKGRPKRTKDLEKLFDSELNQVLRITEGGQSRTITKREAIVKGLVHAALNGDHRAQKLVVGFMQKHHDIDGFELDAAAENILDDRTASETIVILPSNSCWSRSTSKTRRIV